ncbi:MAG: hypothetical protein ACRELA_18805 [Candidatus Rokuibacteriota bacterium]
MASAQIAIHRTDEHTYHPDPSGRRRWVVRDARGFAVVGPPCDRCGACECAPCECHGVPIHERGCIGLSFAYVLLDSWQALCEPCGVSEGLAVVACTCEPDARSVAPESSVAGLAP